MNRLREIQEQKLEELKQTLDRDLLQNYYNDHTYKDTAKFYRENFNCSIKNFKILLDYFKIERKGTGHNLSHEREKVKQGMIAKYGVDNPQKSEQIKNATKQTNLEKYGVDVASKSATVKDKIRNTNIARSGVENVYQAEEIKKKIKSTFINRYNGAECALQVAGFKEKARKTKLERYGDPGYHNYEKMKQTNLAKYGQESPHNTEKAKQTCIERYGVANVSQLRETHVKKAKTRLKNSIACDGTQLDSGWEVLVYDYAIQKGYNIETQIPVNYNDGTQVTFIDFKINGQLYEIKGTHLLNNCWESSGIKIDDKLKCYKENNVIIITDTSKVDELDPELSYVNIYNLAF